MYRITIEFPNKEIADEFCGQMSDGFGEDFCDFSFWKQKPNTDGTKMEHFEKIKDEQDREVYFVNSIFLS